jgi:signal transduction histidine kinase
MRIIGLIGTSQQIAQYHFTLRFAEEKRALFGWLEIAGWILAVGYTLLNIAGVFVERFVWSGEVWVPPIEGAYKSFFVFTTFYELLSVIVPVIRLPAIASRQKRLQLFYFFLSSIPLWLSFWGHFLISLGINIYPAGGIMFLLHAAILTYAVLKEKVFDFTIIIRRGLAYSLFSLAIGVFFGAGLWILSAWTETSHASLASGLLFVTLTGMMYAPMLSYLQNTVDRVFFRQAANQQHAIEQFAHESAATIDLNSLARSVCSLIDRTIRPRRTTLFLDDGRGSLVHFCSQDQSFSPGQWPGGMQLPAEFAFSGATAARFRAPERTQSQGGFHMAEGNDALVVPIVHRNQRLGCFLLEPKRADEPYNDDDVRLAEAIAAQSAVTLQNARSFAQLERNRNLARVGEAISNLNDAIHRILQPVHQQIENLAALNSQDPVVKRAILIIMDRLEAINRLLSVLKDISRPIELRIQTVELSELTASVLRDIEALSEAKAVAFKTEISADARCLHGDEHWLRQVLYNLLRNSVEATHGRANPEVTIQTTRADGKFRIAVKDNGCGIDEAAQKRLFSLFYSTKGEAGTGLGLSICRRIIELHGGQIDVASRAGEGTTMTLSLPAQERPVSERP